MPTENKNQEEKKENPQKHKPRKSKFSLIWKIGVVLLLIFGGVSSLSFWSRLTLKVTVEEELFVLSEEVEVSTAQAIPDASQKIIPGKIFEGAESQWKTFESTGSDTDEAKATGVITVFNKHNPARSVSLVANTRFLSASGKTFLITKKIVAPKAIINGRDITPGSLKVEVIAQEPGEDYNIEPSSFSVPGLLGDELYHSIWAESTEKMVGGDKQWIKKITESDIENAKNVLKESLRKTIHDKLKAENPEFIFVDEAVVAEDFTATCFQKAGEILNEFDCQGETSLKWLAFREEDGQTIALEFLSSNLPFAQTVRVETAQTDFEAKTVLASEEKMILGLDINANSYTPINESIFLSRIAGEKEEAINEIIEGHYEQITKTEFEFWPFWVSKAPKDITKITLDISFDQGLGE